MRLEDQIKTLNERIAALEKANTALKAKQLNVTHEEELISVETVSQQREQLLKYNKELEQFTYVATHDLKSPLANIQGYLDLLELDIDNPSPEVTDSIKWLKFSVTEARHVIHELTNALKARNNKAELLNNIDLDTLVESILSGMRSRIIKNKVIFISDFTELNNFKYYPVALRSILQNIISNAIQYSSKTDYPEIILRTELIANEVHISIKDNGVGIDLESDKTKVFGLFKRIHNDNSGSGIGMYIVNKLLENYGGRLALESEINVGSIFTVVIPYEKV